MAICFLYLESRDIYSGKPDSLILSENLVLCSKPAKAVWVWTKIRNQTVRGGLDSRLGLCMPEKRNNILLFDNIDGLVFFQVFLVLVLSCCPLPQEGTTAVFPALRSSHTHFCRDVTISLLRLVHSKLLLCIL